MQLYKATHVSYVLVHTDLGFFKIDSLGKILQWDDFKENWSDAVLSDADAAQLLSMGLGKLSEFKP